MSLPIPLNMHIVPFTQYVPSLPRFVKTLEHGNRGEAANLDLFNHPISCRFSIHNELILNPMLNLRKVSRGLVEYIVISFNPNGLKCDVSE